MRILYGWETNFIDVTNICFNRLMKNNIIIIPSGNLFRDTLFLDTNKGVGKKIYVIINNSKKEYGPFCKIRINTKTKKVFVKQKNFIHKKLKKIQSGLMIKHGNFNEEVPEQMMATRFLTGEEKVLEIGGNIGRNSLIIASILKNSADLVTLECDPEIARQLKENREINHLHFHIEESALSLNKLIQKGWDTIPSDVLKEGYNWVDTITLEELKSKYQICFDTLVLDCEGAFYYILKDMPSILDNINLIIMENDYTNISHKDYIDTILTEKKFNRIFVKQGGWGPCEDRFFETWERVD
jgi:FkbM family methyltransferase